MKKLVSALLALALCLGLGGTALGADGGAVLPRLDVALGTCEDYELSANDEYVQYGMDPFQCASATVALADIDSAFGYVRLLRDGPFQLEMTYCDELVYTPGTTTYLAAFDYTGGADTGVLPPGGVPVGGGQALGVMIYLDEEGGTADILVAYGKGFSFTDSWDGREPPPPAADSALEAAPDPAAAQSPVAAADDGDRDGTLPDPYMFFNGDLSYDYETKGDGSQVYIEFYFDTQTADPAAAYVALLSDPRYNLTLTGEEHLTGSDGSLTGRWRFDYTGAKQVGQVSFYDPDDPKCSFYVWYSTVAGYHQATNVNIWYAPDGFTFADYGNRYSERLTDRYEPDSGKLTGILETVHPGEEIYDYDDDGSSGIATSDHERTKMRIPCSKCHGSGKVDCSRCGGDKGKWVYDNSVPDYSGHSSTTARTWESCSKCNGTGEVTCPTCGGDRYIYV